MPPRGRGRGGARGGRGQSVPAPFTARSAAESIKTVGVRRPGYGSSGREVSVNVNAFGCTLPDGIIYHYDVAITPEDNATALNMRIIKELQNGVAPHIFADTGAVYDGQKNVFSAVQLQLGGDSREFDVPSPDSRPNTDRPPRVFKVRLTLVATINAELLHRFMDGQHAQDNIITTALMALNVVIKMAPAQQYPTKGRSFFTPQGSKNIGGGLVLWRGYFQSVRPSLGRPLINLDISTGVMYQPGPLIDLSLAFLKALSGNQGLNPSHLTSQMPDRLRVALRRFITGLRVQIQPAGGGPPSGRVIRGVSKVGANNHQFQLRDGRVRTVAQYYQETSGRPLRFPAGLCIEVGKDAMIPFEMCVVPPGQLVRKEFPEDKRTALVEFATMKPKERFASVRQGLQVLAYGQSEYVRKFGISVDPTPLEAAARVLIPPKLKYGGTGPGATVNPRDGSWNMVDRKFIRPATVTAWVLAITDNRVNEQNVNDIARDFVKWSRETGMTFQNPEPLVKRINGQGDVHGALLQAGGECARQKKVGPNLFVIVLPDATSDLYTIVKNWGDIKRGVATQCLRTHKCTRAKQQYWANVALKINVKLGGINVIPDPQSNLLADPRDPIVVMGVDVMHPPPGTTGRPSYSALVSSVDANAAKYIGLQRMQLSRQELVTDLREMVKHGLTKYMDYREKMEKAPSPAPKRLLFYRDGVSESQFQQVLDEELPLIKEACAEKKINPKITLIIVGKRHHIRFFPKSDQDADRSGNCRAGTVVDRDITHPTEFDFYLQSHAGLLGTSRPAHYSVLYDANEFKPDVLQALSFALCHVYARATRSVSIPAPVYCASLSSNSPLAHVSLFNPVLPTDADIVCSRAKIHFDPFASRGQTETGTTTTDASESLEQHRRDYLPLHANQMNVMYFS